MFSAEELNRHHCFPRNFSVHVINNRFYKEAAMWMSSHNELETLVLVLNSHMCVINRNAAILVSIRKKNFYSHKRF